MTHETPFIGLAGAPFNADLCQPQDKVYLTLDDVPTPVTALLDKYA